MCVCVCLHSNSAMFNTKTAQNNEPTAYIMHALRIKKIMHVQMRINM